MVAMALLGVGIMSLLEANTSTVTFQTMARNRTAAIAIASGHLEELRMRDPRTLVAETGVRVNDEGTPNPAGAYVRSVVLTELRQNLLEVTVTVEYPRGSVPITLDMRLFLPEPEP